MKKLHILTFHNALNYGAVLQCYALYSTVNEIIPCDVLNYHSPAIEGAYSVISFKSSIKRNIKGILLFKKNKTKRKKFDEFISKNITLSKRYNSFDELKEETWNIDDIFCVGSDQVWNADLTNYDEAFFLNFLSKNIKKISYAASLGKALPDSDTQLFKRMLLNFDYISVREHSARESLLDIGIDCTQNIDPVYLIEKDKWEDISTYVASEEEDYILIFLLQKSKTFMQKAITFAEENKKKIVIITSIELRKKPGVTYVETCSPQEFVRYIMKANTIFTNSFHGISLSIILNKNFFFEYLESKHKTNSRLKDIISLFDLEKRDSALYENIPYNFTTDFNEINNKIKIEREKSINFLKQAIFKDATKD